MSHQWHHSLQYSHSRTNSLHQILSWTCKKLNCTAVLLESCVGIKWWWHFRYQIFLFKSQSLLLSKRLAMKPLTYDTVNIFISRFISIYYYYCVYIIIQVYSYRANQERCRPSPAVGVQRSRNNQRTQTCWNKQLIWGIGVYVLRTPEVTPSGCIQGIRWPKWKLYWYSYGLCVCVIGNEKTIEKIQNFNRTSW